MTGFNHYVVDRHIGVMLRNNLPNYVRWYVRRIVSRIRPRPWAALRLFVLMPFSLLKIGLTIAWLGKVMILGGLMYC